ncbi:MAG: hypothetical protein KJ697_02890 [Nanoarchaeota archaeon]|nr:hypothetical protein [Nanoarchaeota archaeon]
MNNFILLTICLILIILVSGCVAPISEKTIIDKMKNSTSSMLKGIANTLIDNFVTDFFNSFTTNNTNSTS